MDQQVVKKSISIKAEPAKVWEALTNGNLTKKYFFGCRVSSKWEPGRSIKFKRKFLWMKFELKGKIIKIEPGKLLQYTLQNSSGSGKGFSLVTDELSFKDGKTILSITDDVGSAEGAEKRYRKSMKGWDKVLSGLKDLLEKEN